MGFISLSSVKNIFALFLVRPAVGDAILYHGVIRTFKE
jgi:hypothetical protein